MEWLKTTFKQYCESQGYIILQDDLKFIEKKLLCMPTHKRRPILFEYCNVWKRAMENERDSNKRQSTGRTAANKFLNQYKDIR